MLQGDRLATGSEALRVWDLASGRQLHCLTGHGDLVTALCFHPSKASDLVSGSAASDIKLWDAESGKEARCVGEHSSSVTCMCYR